jgi:hypothetical protein
MNIVSVSAKDKAKLIKTPNKKFKELHIARAIIQEAPDSMIDFYIENQARIDAHVVIVRNEKDLPRAAHHRNSGAKILFIFSNKVFADSYFTGTCEWIKYPNSLIERFEKNSI